MHPINKYQCMYIYSYYIHLMYPFYYQVIQINLCIKSLINFRIIVFSYKSWYFVSSRFRLQFCKKILDSQDEVDCNEVLAIAIYVIECWFYPVAIATANEPEFC